MYVMVKYSAKIQFIKDWHFCQTTTAFGQLENAKQDLFEI